MIPDTITVSGFYAEDIVTALQVRVRGSAAIFGLDPILIKPFEHIGIAVFLWRTKIQGREFKCNKILPIG